jgi:hypothetical protein
MTNVLITEGTTDSVLMQSLIQDQSIKYIATGGWSSADSLARSYLTDPLMNVVLVVDADSSDPSLIEERRRFLNRSLGQIADASRWRVLVVAPEIEALLFENRTVLEELLQNQVDDTDLIRGQYEPKKVLEKISGQSRDMLYRRLSNIDLDPIRAAPEIQSLRQFLGSKQKVAA